MKAFRGNGIPDLLILLTLVNCILLAANLAAHGPGAWGFQGGGHESARFMGLQYLMLVSSFFIALRSLWHSSRITGKGGQLAGLAVLFVFANVLFFGFACRAFTSLHGQGSENFYAFSILVVISLFFAISAGKYSASSVTGALAAGEQR